MCVMASICRRAFPCAGGTSWSSSVVGGCVSVSSCQGEGDRWGVLLLRAFLFLRASETAAAGPLLRAMWLVVVDLGRVGPLGALFPPFVVGPIGWAGGGEAWEVVMRPGGGGEAVWLHLFICDRCKIEGQGGLLVFVPSWWALARQGAVSV